VSNNLLVDIASRSGSKRSADCGLFPRASRPALGYLGESYSTAHRAHEQSNHACPFQGDRFSNTATWPPVCREEAVSHVVVQCPKCSTRFKLKAGPQANGAKVVCKKCETAFRVRLKQRARPKPDDDEIIDVGDDAVVDDEPVEEPDVADDWDESPVDDEFGDPSPPARSAKARSSNAPSLPGKIGQNVFKKPGKSAKSRSREKANDDEDQDEEEDSNRSNAPIVIAVVLAVMVAAGGLGVGGYFLVQAVQRANRFVVPSKYVDFNPPAFPLSGKIPEGWEEKHGGGEGGMQAWVRLTDGKASIEARESISGGAMGQAAIALQQKFDPQGKLSELTSPVGRIHEAQKAAMEDIFTDYEEQPDRKIQTAGWGEARISDFTAKDGLMKSPIRGCRATILDTIHQFTITCKCPPSQFEAAKPVFEKVIASFNVGSSR
jgi:hypothetical protein